MRAGCWRSNGIAIGVMDEYLPHWRQHRKQLNRLPVRHEEWQY